MPPQIRPTEPDEIAFAAWWSEIIKGKPANWLPGVRQAFTEGWRQGNKTAYADIKRSST